MGQHVGCGERGRWCELSYGGYVFVFVEISDRLVKIIAA